MLVFEKHWTFWRNLKYADVSAVQRAASDRRQLGRLSGCRSIRVPGPAAVFSRSASPPRHAAAKGEPAQPPLEPWSQSTDLWQLIPHVTIRLAYLVHKQNAIGKKNFRQFLAFPGGGERVRCIAGAGQGSFQLLIFCTVQILLCIMRKEAAG